MKNKIGISRFTEKKENVFFFKQKLHTVTLIISDIAWMRFRHFEQRPTTSQQGSTISSRSCNIIYYVITVVKNNKDIREIMVYGELNIYFSFHEK